MQLTGRAPMLQEQIHCVHTPAVVVYIALLSPRAQDQIWLHFDGRELQKHPCTMHLVHVTEPQVVKINPESPSTTCLIIGWWFWHLKPHNYLEFRKVGVKYAGNLQT